jgi:hypothetical protein
MVDINGVPVTVGARCKYFLTIRDIWIEGTVRKVKIQSYYNNYEQRTDVWEAKVDDGDPANPDIETNGFHTAAVVESNDIEIIT